MKKAEMDRVFAVERYRRGEDPQAICASVGRSLRWLYKWVERADADEEAWFIERSRRPESSPVKTSDETVRLIVATRKELEREGCFHGAASIIWELEERKLQSPSARTINRILRTHGCFKPAERRYERKGVKYPAPVALRPNDVHQADFVGPRYLRGGVRFYSLNVSDVTTGRSRTTPIVSRASESVAEAMWGSWISLGFPRICQVDNELVFWGSRRHPRSMSQFIRLCLLHEVEPLFIPPSEPWRNGVIEKFNDHWQQKFLRRAIFTSLDELAEGSAAFDAKVNARWRYAKNGGCTPNDALRRANVDLRFPPTLAPPPPPLLRPTSGHYHLIRFIRSDRRLEIFGEHFTLPKSAVYEYATATIDVATEELRVTIDAQPVATFEYQST